MKLLKVMLLCLSGVFVGFNAAGQANASINVLTQTSGQVNLGGTTFIQVNVANTGPTSSIGMNKMRVRISVPIAIVSIPASGHVLPAGWTILTNTGDVITICNGSDVIGVNDARQLMIAVKGDVLGGPSTVTGVLLFSNGTNCNVTGTLPGDQTADNTSTSTIEVVPALACTRGVSATAGTITCNGGTTALTATPTGANGAVEYNINNGPFQSDNTFTVGAGTYTVIARQVNNISCTATASAVTVTQPAAVTAPAIGTITQPTCTTATGSVGLSGLPAGNWTITTNPGSATTAGTGASTTINGLAPGNYTFTVTNAALCISTASANAIINAQPLATAPVVNVVQPTCTVATGTITVTSSTAGLTFSFDGAAYAAYPAGGYTAAAGPHTLTAQNTTGCISTVTNISINPQPATPSAPVAGTITQPTCALSTGSVDLSGLPAGNWTVNPGVITGNTTTTIISGLAQGTYNFTVTNAAGCTSAASGDVMINTVPGAPAAPVVSVAQPTCTVATGTITVTSSTTGLTFSLDGAAYSTYPAGGYTVAAGPHTLSEQNASSCISAIANITVDAQPATPIAPDVSVIQPTCTVATGTITVTSATAGLTFSLDGGIYVIYPAAGYTAIIPGPHTLRAQNTSGCISLVTNTTVNPQPASPTATAAAGTIACNSGNTTLTVTATGGIAPLEYNLNGGTYQPGNTFTVVAGTYAVTVRDANLCAGMTTPVIVTAPAAITATASAATVSCASGTTTITTTATGGTAPLQYSLNGGTFQTSNSFTVTPGVYTITVKDANLCTVSAAAVTITQPANLVASATANRITQCGGITIVTVTASGGIPPYQFTGGSTFTRGPGTWTFPVTDAGGCTATASITIEAPGCKDLKVYPNPATSTINVNHSTAAAGSFMKVFDINGALVLSKAVPQDAFLTTIDVNKLAAGCYVLVYFNGSEKKEMLFRKVTSN